MNETGSRILAGQPLSVRIREAEQRDVPAIVAIHMVSFPGFFATMLGPGFLRAYFRLLLQFDRGILLVAEREGEIVGFVEGFGDPPRYRKAMAAHKWRFGLYALLAMSRRPFLFWRVFWNARRVMRAERNEDKSGQGCVELSGIAVLPHRGRQGVGTKLVCAFAEMARRQNGVQVYLSTDARDNNGVNAFYQRLGFRLNRTRNTPGKRLMNDYVLQL